MTTSDMERRVGVLEGNVDQINTRLGEIAGDLRGLRQEMRDGFDKVNDQFNKVNNQIVDLHKQLNYVLLGVIGSGVALVAAILGAGYLPGQ